MYQWQRTLFVFSLLMSLITLCNDSWLTSHDHAQEFKQKIEQYETWGGRGSAGAACTSSTACVTAFPVAPHSVLCSIFLGGILTAGMTVAGWGMGGIGGGKYFRYKHPNPKAEQLLHDFASEYWCTLHKQPIGSSDILDRFYQFKKNEDTEGHSIDLDYNEGIPICQLASQATENNRHLPEATCSALIQRMRQRYFYYRLHPHAQEEEMSLIDRNARIAQKYGFSLPYDLYEEEQE